jgi:hypothetical protein
MIAILRTILLFPKQCYSTLSKHTYFTVDRFKTAYDVEIALMPSKNKWSNYNLDYNLLPPILKRPARRPKRNIT